MLEDLLKDLILVDRHDGEIGPLIVGTGVQFQAFTPTDIVALSNAGVRNAVVVGTAPANFNVAQIKAIEATENDNDPAHDIYFFSSGGSAGHITLRDTAALIHDLLDGATWGEALHNTHMLALTVTTDLDVIYGPGQHDHFKTSFQQLQSWEEREYRLHHNDTPAQQEQQVERFLDHWHL